MHRAIVVAGMLLTLPARGADYATPTLIYGGGALADILSTQSALSRGGQEQNALLRGQRSLVGWKAAQAAGLTTADVLLQKHKKTKLAWILRGAFAAWSLKVTLHNSRQGR